MYGGMYGVTAEFQDDSHWRNLVLSHGYFRGDNGARLGQATRLDGVIATLLDLFGRDIRRHLQMEEKARLQDRLARQQARRR
jgi:hypothetical protein